MFQLGFSLQSSNLQPYEQRCLTGTMPPVIHIERLTELVHQSGIEYMTNPREMKLAWLAIAEKYCEERGLELLDYKKFATKWKNAKCYAKKIAAVTKKELTDPPFRLKSDTNASESSEVNPKRSEIQIVTVQSQTRYHFHYFLELVLDIDRI
jgi:hypothetical protein